MPANDTMGEMKMKRPLTNYEAAIRAERKRVVRCFHAFTSEQRANLAASHRLGHRQRAAIGQFFYVHPGFPGTAFATRKAAVMAALAHWDN